MKIIRFIKLIYLKFIEFNSPEKVAIMKGVKAGDNFHIYGHVYWGSEPWIITIGNNVHITDGVRFITHDGGTLLFRKDIPDLEVTKPINIGNDVYIGVNSIIMPGVKIGNNVVIGSGSVVTKNIESGVVVAGVPARVLKTTDEYLEKLKAESLHFGHLNREEKEKSLRNYYNM